LSIFAFVSLAIGILFGKTFLVQYFSYFRSYAKRSTNGKQTHKEILDICSHKEMKNKMMLRFYFTPFRTSRKQTRNSGKGAGINESFYTVRGECKLV
jgi:hypothetical protein